MATTPFASRGSGNLILRDGDVVTGDSDTGAAGGDLTLEGGDASSGTNTDGGSLVLRPGIGDGAGILGNVEVTNRVGTEDDAVLVVSSSAGNAHSFSLRTGTVQPNEDSVPSTAAGDLYVQSDGSLWIADSAGTGGWSRLGTSAWSEQLAQTNDASVTTIATLVSPVTDGTQQSVEVLIYADSGGSNTYFRRQVFTFYRDGAGAVQWTSEVNGVEARRGFTTATASLAVSGNDIIVSAAGEAATTVDWRVQYRTTSTITEGGVGPSQALIREVFDNRGAPEVTGSATGSGGTVDFTLNIGVSYGSLQYLRVRTSSGTCSDASVRFFRDIARTDEIYLAANKDTSTTNGWVDRNTATLMGDDGSGLESDTLYGRVTNNDAGTAAFAVEAVVWGVG